MTYIITNKNYLAHHGVKGQRWGIRRQRQTTSSQDSSNTQKRGISDKTKRRIKTVVKVGAGVAAAYGAYKLQKYLKTPAGRSLVKKGQKAVNRALNKKITGLNGLNNTINELNKLISTRAPSATNSATVNLNKYTSIRDLKRDHPNVRVGVVSSSKYDYIYKSSKDHGINLSDLTLDDMKKLDLY